MLMQMMPCFQRMMPKQRVCDRGNMVRGVWFAVVLPIERQEEVLSFVEWSKNNE
jgi:hypothetical protein